ncbi:MAG: pirin family protein [Planctomycetota bacterium]
MTTPPTTSGPAQTGLLVRKAAERGSTDIGWLDSRHTFSFGRYRDPVWRAFGPLRVMNDDRVAPGAGFGTHPHRDMEIISYVVSGHLEHQDSAGHGSIIGPGGVQVMSAGTGIEHSEFNPNAHQPVRFLQIWIEPDRTDHEPSHDSREFAPARTPNSLQLIVSGDGRDGSLAIHRDADISALSLDGSTRVDIPRGGDRRVWIQVVSGSVTAHLGGADAVELAEGDGAGLESESASAEQSITLSGEGEVLVFSIAG